MRLCVPTNFSDPLKNVMLSPRVHVMLFVRLLAVLLNKKKTFIEIIQGQQKRAAKNKNSLFYYAFRTRRNQLQFHFTQAFLTRLQQLFLYIQIVLNLVELFKGLLDFELPASLVIRKVLVDLVDDIGVQVDLV